MGYLKETINKVLSETDVNSRLCFLIHTIVSAICTLIITIAFIMASSKDYYTEFLVVMLSGGVVGGGVSRYLTKRSSGDTTEVSTSTSKGGVMTSKTTTKPSVKPTK